MTAADAFKPGQPFPLDTLMEKLTPDVGPEPSSWSRRMGGGYLASLGTGLVFKQAFSHVDKFIRKLPAKVYPVKQFAQQLMNYWRKSTDIKTIGRFFMDLVRLLILVAPEPAKAKLRQSALNLGDFHRPPNPAVLLDLHKFAKDAVVPSAEDIKIFFEESVSPWSEEDKKILKQIEGQFQEIFHPPTDTEDGADSYGGNSDQGTGSLREPDLERPPERPGILVPGYNYVGPGNPLDNAPAKGPVDEAAKHHDERYDEMLRHGDLPYIHGRGADRLMNKEIERAEQEGKIDNPVDALVGNAIRGIWEAKETLGDIADVQLSQVLPPDPPTSQVLPGSSEDAPSPKRQRAGTPDSVPTPGNPSPAPIADPATIMAAPVTGATGGGIKVKAQWLGGTHFSDNTIVTSHTRTSMLADRGGYAPVYRSGSHVSDRQPVMGMRTPYSYIDVNAISAHLTPRDFQQLLDEYEEIRPKKLVIGISGIVIKDVSVTTTGTTVSDSASGGITVFSDDAYDYPYVLGHNQDTLPGHLPGENYVLPQYGYLTRGREFDKGTDIVGIADHRSELYFLEHHDAECLGSGDTWSHAYEFPSDLPFRRLTTPNQSLYARHNPIPPSRLAIMTGVDNSGVPKWKRPAGEDVGKHPLNYVPGPSVMMPTDSQIRNTDFRVPLAIGNPVTGDRYSVGPLVHQPWSIRTEEGKSPPNNFAVHSYLGGVAYTRRRHEESYTGHTEEMDGSVTNPSRVVVNEVDMAAPHVGHTFMVPGHTRVDGSGSGSDTVYDPKLYQEPIFPLFPAAVWNPNPLTYDCQIWTKIPDTECRFFAQYPLLGGWGMDAPPPMVFLKMRSQPGPPPGGAHTVPNSNLNQYAIFHLHYTIEWEVKRRRRSRRHNPEKPAPFPTTDSGRMPFMLANDDRDPNVPVYEVPSDQWVAQNFSRKL
nr:capsid protein [Porcine parvovirus 3]